MNISQCVIIYLKSEISMKNISFYCFILKFPFQNRNIIYIFKIKNKLFTNIKQ